MLFHTSSLLLFATPALGQTLNNWRQTVFNGCCGITGHEASQAVDGNVTSYDEVDSLPNQLSLLFNFPATYLGFYVQSSGAYITDYYVEAVESITEKEIIIGRVSNATSNFTVVEFYNSAGTAGIHTETILFYITGVSDGGSTAFTNEIYPIYPGDTIVYPPGQSIQSSPTQSAQASSTQSTTVTPTSTSTQSTTSIQPTISTPSTTSPPTTTAIVYPTPTIPGVTLNSWPTISATKPFPQGQAYIDGNPSTASSSTLYDLLFNTWSTYEGFYILSQSPNYITDYHVIAQNAQTLVEYEVCRVTGAPSNFTLCAFMDEKGKPGYFTDVIFIQPDAVLNDAAPEISEVYPIWPGDYIADPNA